MTDQNEKWSGMMSLITPGLPDSTKWSYDLGNGCPEGCGWGN